MLCCASPIPSFPHRSQAARLWIRRLRGLQGFPAEIRHLRAWPVAEDWRMANGSILEQVPRSGCGSSEQNTRAQMRRQMASCSYGPISEVPTLPCPRQRGKRTVFSNSPYSNGRNIHSTSALYPKPLFRCLTSSSGRLTSFGAKVRLSK